MMRAMAVGTAVVPRCAAINQPTQISFAIAETGTAIVMMKSSTGAGTIGASVTSTGMTIGGGKDTGE